MILGKPHLRARPSPRTDWIRDALATVVPPAGRTRVFALSTFVESIGAGAFLSVSTVYLVRVIGLSADLVGVGLSTAGTAGLLASLPLGTVADRFPPRKLLIALTVAFSALLCVYTQVRSFPVFLPIMCLTAVCQSGIGPARGAITADLAFGKERIRIASYLRSATNLGLVLGALLGGLVLASGFGPASFRTLIIADAVAVLCSALVLLRMPTRALGVGGSASSSGRQRWWGVLRDGPFLAFTAQYAVLALTNVIYFVGAPLWILERTRASTWVVAGLLVEGCVAIGLFQVRVGTRISNLQDSAAMLVRGGRTLALACLPFGISSAVGQVWADLAILTAGILLAYGEMQVAAGSWGMAYGLAPEGQQGAYQGMFGLGLNAATLIGPLGLTLLVVDVGATGWLVLAAAFILAGALTPWTLRWALAHPARASLEG